MSTRSLIGIKNEDGSITDVYCHFDGYLDGVGITLVNHYDTEEKIREIFEHGDMSSLGDDIKSCDFYKDRGEDGVDAGTIPADIPEDVEDAYYVGGQHCWADYVYLFKDGKWYYARESVKRTEDGHGIVYGDKGEPVYNPAEWKLVTDGLKKTAE